MDVNEAKTQEKSIETDAETTKSTETTINISKNASENTTIKQEEITVAKQTIKEETYSLKEFIKNSEALGYSKEVVTGALFNCEKSELTRTEFETIIKNFLGKKVK